MSLRILITGGTGFIGQAVTRRLIEEGNLVSIVTRDAGRLPNDITSKSTVIQTDIGVRGALEQHLYGMDAVLHLAVFIPPNQRDPIYARECLDINALGTLNLLQEARKAQVKHFIYYSSGNIYRFKPSPVSEEDAVYPAQLAPFYLSSKLMGELYVEHFRVAYGMKTTVLRLSSVYGPGMKNHEVLARFLFSLLANQPIELLFGGQQTADFVYVGDVAAITSQVLHAESDGIFNVGSGQRTSLLELAEIIRSLTQANEDLIAIHPAAAHAQVHTGFAALDISRAILLLDYSPTRLEQGLKHWIELIGASSTSF